MMDPETLRRTTTKDNNAEKLGHQRRAGGENVPSRHKFSQRGTTRGPKNHIGDGLASSAARAC